MLVPEAGEPRAILVRAVGCSAILRLAVRAAAIACLVCPAAADEYEVEFKADVVYGTGGGEDLKLDLATPKGQEQSAPGLVLIHGGGWQGGNKRHFAEVARRAAGKGYVAVSVGYRFAPDHRFPAQIEDCKCAVRWMRAHADELRLDTDHLGAMGMSAGGHLSTMLGTLDTADGMEGEGGWPEQSSKVQAVVNFVGPVNLEGEYPSTTQKILETFLGGTADEKQETYKQASPITWLNEGDAPMLFFAGTSDQLVPYDQAFQWINAMHRAKVLGRVEVLVGAGHGWGGDEMERTLEAAFDFLDQHLK